MNPRLALVAVILASACAAFFFTSWIGFGAILLASIGLIVAIVLPDDADVTKFALGGGAFALGVYGAFADYSLNVEIYDIMLAVAEAQSGPTAPEISDKAVALIQLCGVEPIVELIDSSKDLVETIYEPPALSPFSWMWKEEPGRKDCKKEAQDLAQEWPELKLRLDGLGK